MRKKNKYDDDIVDIEDSEPMSSPESVSKPSSPPKFDTDKPNFYADKDAKIIDIIGICCKKGDAR